jgi:hypothetical protein
MSLNLCPYPEAASFPIRKIRPAGLPSSNIPNTKQAIPIDEVAVTIEAQRRILASREPCSRQEKLELIAELALTLRHKCLVELRDLNTDAAGVVTHPARHD